MFCDRCGRPFSGTESFCASCGKPLRAVPTACVRAGRIEGHIKGLGIFWIVYSVFRMLGGFVLSRFLAHWSPFWSPNIPLFIPGIWHGIGFLLLSGGLLGVLAGWGLMERQSWARVLAIVLGIFALFHFPLGTVLGIYTLWVLLPADSAQEYERTARAM